MTFLLPYFLLLVSLSLPLLIYAQSSNNITIGSSLIAGSNPTSFWASPSKDFAFGFQEIKPGSFLLAIWLEAIPEKTITWSANRDRLVPKGSKVELTIGNGLALSDQTGQEIWQAEADGLEVGYGAMLDTGNFVLATSTFDVLWQSFDKPTDTILPTQILNLGTQLIARFSEKNYSSGRFMMQLGTNGNLGLYTTSFPMYNSTNTLYQALDTSGSGYQGVFNQSGLLYLVAKNGSIVNYVFTDGVINDEFYQRVIIEYDGVLRHYVYPKSKSLSTGWSFKSMIPDNICTAILEGTGSGMCGFNSYCSLGDDRTPYCSCPPGYVLLDPNNKMSGCTPDFPSQSCIQEPMKQKDEYDFKVLINVDWPLSDYEHFSNVNKDWCRDVCLGDCFCAVSVFRETGDCWKKRLPLSNGKNDSSVDRTTFIKVGTGNSTGNSTGTNVDLSSKTKDKSKHGVWAILFGISGFGNLVLVICFLVFGFFFFSTRKKGLIIPKSEARVNDGYNVCSFTYKELVDATNDFKEEIGRGAFGIVYRGILGTSEIAVKKLDSILRDANKEFKAEVNAIAHTHHKNLVQLVGYCGEENHRLLVYEYMSNGTLSDFLYVVPKPSWKKRIQIAKGISRGLLYLHEDCCSQIIHCDIKPQNILLDDEYNAKISDFGLAKLLRLDQTQTNTMVRGTRGYVAPEWFRGKSISSKIDVYSFGVLLLEIICCRKNVIHGDEDDAINVLTEKVFDCYQEGKIELLVEDDVEAINDEVRLEKMVKVGIWCIQEDPNLRPTMRMAVQMIEGLVHVPEPPLPETSSVTLTR